MLQELLSKLEIWLGLMGGNGGTLPYVTLIPEQRDALRKSAMNILVAIPKFINALAPINKLPPEILGMIPNYQEGKTARGMVVVSSVCSYWRETFLATPSLWTRLDGKGIEKTRAWIERSRTLPIQLRVEDSPDLQVLKFLARHSHRLEVVEFPQLKVQDRFVITHNHLSKLLLGCPRLREVSFETSHLGTFKTPIIMSGKFPSLESLHAMGIPISITDLRTPKLRSLDLAGKFHFENLLDLLESSPLLENLVLRLDPRQPAFDGTGRTVVLEKLKQAYFFDHGFRVLRHLSLPACSDVKMTEELPLRRLDGTTREYARLLSQAFSDLPVFRQIESISFHELRSRWVVLLKGSNGTLEFTTCKTDDPTISFTLLRLFAQYSTESIEHLMISNLFLSPMHSDLVGNFLRLFGGLQSITVHQSLARLCLPAMGTSHCLRLQEITIQCQSPLLPYYHGLIKFFRDRRDIGIPIQWLIVESDFEDVVSEGEMETLQEYIECVVLGPICYD